MDHLVNQLTDAAMNGDLAGIRACLAAGADVNWHGNAGWTALQWAARRAHPECVAALLAAGADARAADGDGYTPLHKAVSGGSLACVELLLEAGANPLALVDGIRLVELAAYERPVLVPVLLQAVPAQALAEYGASLKMSLLSILLNSDIGNLDCARNLLAQGALPPSEDVLFDLSDAGSWAQPLYAILASRQPLTAWEWGLVPMPCDGLAAALPAVLQRSSVETALLVQHLHAADRERLRTAALCLGRVQRQADAPLPTPILWHLLLQSVADSAAEVPAPAASD